MARGIVISGISNCFFIDDSRIFISLQSLPFTFIIYITVFGGWENYRTTVRRKRDDMEMKFEYTDQVLASKSPLKALIEITTHGEIRIFIEHKIVAVLETRDPSPLSIKYVAFASLQHSLAEFFYACKGEDIYTKKQLEGNCQTYETKENQFREFHPLQSRIQKKYTADEFIVNTLFYAEARRAIRILLSQDNVLSNGYEIGRPNLNYTDSFGID